MKTISKIGVGAIALTMLATTPAAAQSYRDRDRDNTGRDAVIGALEDPCPLLGGALPGKPLDGTSRNCTANSVTTRPAIT